MLNQKNIYITLNNKHRKIYIKNIKNIKKNKMIYKKY